MTVTKCSPCVQGNHRCQVAACACCHGQPRVTLTLVADQPPAAKPPVRIGPWHHHRAPWGHQMIDSPTVGIVIYPIGRDADPAAARIAEQITEFLTQASSPSGRQALSQPAPADVRPPAAAGGEDGGVGNRRRAQSQSPPDGRRVATAAPTHPSNSSAPALTALDRGEPGHLPEGA